MWAQLLNAILGLWLMAAPGVLGYGGLAADNDHVIGPIIATCAIIALWEASRGMRWANLPLGLWLVAAPWIFNYLELAAILNSALAGALIASLSSVRGRIKGRYGGGWQALVLSDDRRDADRA